MSRTSEHFDIGKDFITKKSISKSRFSKCLCPIKGGQRYILYRVSFCNPGRSKWLGEHWWFLPV